MIQTAPTRPIPRILIQIGPQPLSNEQKSLTDKILLQVNRTKALVSSLLNS